MNVAQRTLSIARLGLAATGVVAMTREFAVLNVDPDYAGGSFFSFFTIQANILAVAALGLLAVVPPAARSPSSTGPGALSSSTSGSPAPSSRCSSPTCRRS